MNTNVFKSTFIFSLISKWNSCTILGFYVMSSVSIDNINNRFLIIWLALLYVVLQLATCASKIALCSWLPTVSCKKKFPGSHVIPVNSLLTNLIDHNGQILHSLTFLNKNLLQGQYYIYKYCSCHPTWPTGLCYLNLSVRIGYNHQ